MAVQIRLSPEVIAPISPLSFFVGRGKLFRISLDACRAGQSDEECVEVRTITTLCCASPVNLTIAPNRCRSYRRLFSGYKRTIVTNSKQFQDEDRLEELRITIVPRPCTGTTEKSQKEIHE